MYRKPCVKTKKIEGKDTMVLSLYSQLSEVLCCGLADKQSPWSCPCGPGCRSGALWLGTVSLERGLHPDLALDYRPGFSKRSHRGHEGPEKGCVNALLRTLPAGQPHKLDTGQVLSQERRGSHSREGCGGYAGLIVAI